MDTGSYPSYSLAPLGERAGVKGTQSVEQARGHCKPHEILDPYPTHHRCSHGEPLVHDPITSG